MDTSINRTLRLLLTGNLSTSSEQAEDGLTTRELAIYGATLCFYIVVMVTAVLGNLLVLMATFQNQNLRDSATNLLLANLAVADFCQGAISLPLRIAEEVMSNFYLCRVSIPTTIFFGGTSNLTILFISIERFVSIYRPYAYCRIFTDMVVKVVIAFSWITVAAFSLTSASSIVWRRHISSSCRFPVYLSKAYILALYIYVHIVPITLVILLYGFILKANCIQTCRIYGQHLSVTSNSGSFEMEERSRVLQRLAHLKAVKVVSVVVGLFIVLVLPIIIIDAVEILGGGRPPEGFVKGAVCLIYANNCVNVFVYAGFNQEYRQTFKRILNKFKLALLGRCVRS
ncbi:predicted protein [Nematostella vectensis]|uniref:G-protein coupled receptors family 1 profile domain-containing protein n=1 Tax=Nematostella vectensis TaxID=45351 RepID=A7S2I9_NEMVE|nr:predicted protein [Nematostella vectensis]|eukprot:XP_001634071.1 predicted protein [Nematostella vectensis]